MENHNIVGVPVKSQTKGRSLKEPVRNDKKSLNGNISISPLTETIKNRVSKTVLYGADNYKSAAISHFLISKDTTKQKEASALTRELLSQFLPGDQISEQIVNETLNTFFRKYKPVFLPDKKPKFTFIDLFAGIGGFRLAMQANGGECVFTSEWDKMAQKTYHVNFGEIPFGDITQEETKTWIPDKFDLLCAGFPCQPFSIAGVSKKNSLGRKHGFDDEKQGNLFFHIAEVIEKHRPRAFFLENVKNLMSHDKGNTFKVIKQTLESLNYTFHHTVLNGKHFVPQHRARTFMVGFDKEVFEGLEDFSFPQMPEANHKVFRILEEKKVDDKYILTDHLWQYLQNYAKKRKEKGNGFGFGLVDLNGITRTMSARYYKDGSEILIPRGKNENPRRLTEREAANLQGFPKEFIVDAVSMNQAYKQFGNSVVVPLIQSIGSQIVRVLKTRP
jgi:DNA (cytosine-5)-methyltransferase 1